MRSSARCTSRRAVDLPLFTALAISPILGQNAKASLMSTANASPRILRRSAMTAENRREIKKSSTPHALV
jgi:hypothetical protein